MRDAVIFLIDRIQAVRTVQLRFELSRVYLLVLVGIRDCRPLRIAAMVLLAFGHHDLAIHIEAVNVERRIERVQQCRVI